MNSTLVDLDNEPGNVDQLKKDLNEAIQQEQPAPKDKETQAPDPEPSIPEKYQGKSIEDVIDMHRNAESALGRNANELGQYKQLTDRLLALDKRRDDLLKSGADEAEIEDEFKLPEISSTELLDNPTEAVLKVVDPLLTKAERKRERELANDRLAELETEFASKHPDAGEIANSEEFVQWVSQSPLRLRAAQAAYNKDFQAGIDLLDEYKRSQPSNESSEAENTPNLDAARQASTVSAGATQTGDTPTGKTYRRLDLIRLKLEDPEAYADPSFQQQIMRAYAEGRVK
jgi:hypothetical protein